MENIESKIRRFYPIEENEINSIVSASSDNKMEGSEKQIAWAIDIRAEHMAVAFKFIIEKNDKRLQKRFGTSDREALKKAIIKIAVSQKSSKYWIENKDFPELLKILSEQK